MKKVMAMFLSTALVSSAMMVPLTVSAEAGSKRFCREVARNYADKKASRKAVRNAIVGGIAGGLLGSAIGGRKSTAFGAVGGAGVGVLATDGKWQKYYNRRYVDCRENG